MLASLSTHICRFRITPQTFLAPAASTLIRSIRFMLDFRTTSTIATCIVHSKLDYCNSLLPNLESTCTKRLRFILNSLAQAITRTPTHLHMTSILLFLWPVALFSTWNSHIFAWSLTYFIPLVSQLLCILHSVSDPYSTPHLNLRTISNKNSENYPFLQTSLQ